MGACPTRAAVRIGAMDPAALDNSQVEESRREPALPPVRICVLTMGGTVYEVMMSPSESVRALAKAVAELASVKAYQVQLVNGTEVLQHKWVLHEHGVEESSELTLVVGDSVPDFAEDWGFTPDLPHQLVEFAVAHQLDRPPWLEEPDRIWNMLHEARKKHVADKAARKGWGHFLSLEDSGSPIGTIRAKPGAKVRVGLDGFIFNNNGDSCIHQLVLALDNEIVADVYNGVPSNGRRIHTVVTFDAPRTEGLHMLWRANDLQYSMRDAHNNFRNANRGPPKMKPFPDNFVGWLEVSEDVE